MSASDKSKRQLLEEIRILHSQNAKFERIGLEMPGCRNTQQMPHIDQARFQSLLQIAPSVILYLDRECRILEFNAEAERVYGSRREDVLGKNYLELFLQEDARQAVASGIKKVLAGESTRGFENAVITNEKQERILRWDVGPVLDFEGKPIGIVAVGQDITEHKKTEEALKSERDFAGSLIETTQAIILLIDPEGRIRHFNSYMEQLSGYRLEEVKGKDWFTTFLPKRDQKRIREKHLSQKCLGPVYQDMCSRIIISPS